MAYYFLLSGLIVTALGAVTFLAGLAAEVREHEWGHRVLLSGIAAVITGFAIVGIVIGVSV